ncbi:MAG: hypothetical protein HOQ24_15045, partial [Mycobacteriaceae bacterium]|nr:hypothetical protein [Mycobacteriaceae bacterium]
MTTPPWQPAEQQKPPQPGQQGRPVPLGEPELHDVYQRLFGPNSPLLVTQSRRKPWPWAIAGGLVLILGITTAVMAGGSDDDSPKTEAKPTISADVLPTAEELKPFTLAAGDVPAGWADNKDDKDRVNAADHIYKGDNADCTTMWYKVFNSNGRVSADSSFGKAPLMASVKVTADKADAAKAALQNLRDAIGKCETFTDTTTQTVITTNATITPDVIGDESVLFRSSLSP